jgi:hypothetical protein
MCKGARQREADQVRSEQHLDRIVRRPTKETAEIRNKLVIDLATSVTVIHASPGGLLDQFVSARLDRVGRNPNTLVK